MTDTPDPTNPADATNSDGTTPPVEPTAELPRPEVPPPALAWGAATHSGMVRTENEDNYVAEAMVFAVADGMGGHQAGEVASEIAARTVRERLRTGASSLDVMVAAVVEANAAIFHGAHVHAEQRGMGTTLTAMTVLSVPDQPLRLGLANVGDSRTYLLRDGRLRRVSLDHSYVQELVSTGHITEDEARNHPRRNIVTRALGIEPTVRVDTWVLQIVRGDRFVLCSDGLVDEVDDVEIAGILAANPDPEAAADALVAAANQHGGRDNTTVVVVDVLEGDRYADELDPLDLDGVWGDNDRLVDAEAGVTPRGDMGGATPPTTVLPRTAVSTAGGDSVPSRRSPMGTFLFLVAAGVIATLTVVGVLVVRHNSSDTPAPSTTTTTTTRVTSTTAANSTTSVATSTTAEPTTVAPAAEPSTSGG